MRHPALAAQELWQQWNLKNFFPLKIWVLTYILWTPEPSRLFRLLLNVWQRGTMHQSLIFAMMEPRFALLTNTAIQKGKTVLMCWMELHHQLLFEPGGDSSLGSSFQGITPRSTGLQEDAQVLVLPNCGPQAHPGERLLLHTLLLALASHGNNCLSA